MPLAVAKILTEIALDREFDYLIPGELLERVRIGSVVWVPFGRRRARGFVVGLADKSDFPNLKAIESVTGDLPLFDEAMLRLARWIADYYAAPFESAIAAILPAAVRRDGAKFKEQLVAAVREDAAPTPEDEAALAKKSPKQAAAWELLKTRREMTAAALAEEAGIAPDGLRRLEKKGWIALAKGVIRRDPHAQMKILPTFAPPLMDEQVAALGGDPLDPRGRGVALFTRNSGKRGAAP